MQIYKIKISMKIPTFEEFLNESVTKADLNYAEKLADKWLGKYGIDVEFTKHFLDRINDERNNPAISISELIEMFKKVAEKLGKEFSGEYDSLEAVLKDVVSDINIPFALKPDSDPREDTELIAKTIMRKPNFQTSNKIFKV